MVTENKYLFFCIKNFYIILQIEYVILETSIGDLRYRFFVAET